MLHALWSAVSEKLCKLSNYLWYGFPRFIDSTWGGNLATCIETVNKFQHADFPVQQLVEKKDHLCRKIQILFPLLMFFVIHRSFISLFLIYLSYGETSKILLVG